MFKISLGAKVRDKITGLEGVVTWRADYLTGCNRYGVQGPVNDGKVPESHGVDEMALEVLDEPVLSLSPQGPVTAG